MVLYIIGLGLGDEKDITVRGLECIQRSSGVYLEVLHFLMPFDSLHILILSLALYFHSLCRYGSS